MNRESNGLGTDERCRRVAAALSRRQVRRAGRRHPGRWRQYFPSAWVCINMLRQVGCTLPIELWHLGPDEMSEETNLIFDVLEPHPSQ